MFTDFPEAPAVEGYVFIGNYEETYLGGESRIALMTEIGDITENILITYIYEEAEFVEPDEPPKTGTVSMGGGNRSSGNHRRSRCDCFS